MGLGGVNRIAGQRIRQLKSERISGLADFENTADCLAAVLTFCHGSSRLCLSISSDRRS